MWMLLVNVAAVLLGVALFLLFAGTALAVLCLWHARRDPASLKDVDPEEIDREIAYLKARAAARDAAAADRRLGRRFLHRTLTVAATVLGTPFVAPLVFAVKLGLARTRRISGGK